MKLPDLLNHYAKQLQNEREAAMDQGLDALCDIPQARHIRTAGSLHHYALVVPEGQTLLQDVPVTILPSDGLEPTEGYVMGQLNHETYILTLDSLGKNPHNCTLIPDTSGYLETIAGRLTEMASKPEAFTLGPTERLVPWVDPDPVGADAQCPLGSFGVDPHYSLGRRPGYAMGEIRTTARRTSSKKQADFIDGSRPSRHRPVDKSMARSLRNAALPIKSLLSRYEMPLCEEAGGVLVKEFGFEAHMHQFYAKANAHKVALRKQYDRFRELTPILAYKRDKQKDLNEVKLLEWRLLTELSDWQGKVKNIDKIVGDYEAIPIWKRIAMQAAGKNVETLAEYRTLYEEKIQVLMREVEVAQQRIRELVPEATIPKDMRPEYDELKEEINRLGGTKKIREMLAAGEGTNRQAFIQNKRILATTAGRIITDPVFKRVRFDILVVDDAPKIPAPLLLGAAGIVRERIILSGDTQDLLPSQSGDSKAGLGSWNQQCLPIQLGSEPQPSNVG